MFRTRVLGVATLCLPLGAWPLTSDSPAPSQFHQVQAGPMEVTTDTPEYCQKLLNRMGELVRLATMPIPREVSELTSEGQRMCAHGQTRSGIMRIRSALMMMKEDGPAYR